MRKGGRENHINSSEGCCLMSEVFAYCDRRIGFKTESPILGHPATNSKFSILC